MSNIKNLAADFVATAPSPATTGTSLSVRTGAGATFPAPPFYITLTPPSNLSTSGVSEIVLVTAVSGDTFTITRAQKGTTAKSVAVGWVVTNGIYTEDLFSSSITMGEVPSGTVNGTNTTFTVSTAFSSIELFVNGVRQMQGSGNDFTVSGTTITFAVAPPTGSNLLANYITGSSVMIAGSNSLVTDEVPTGTVNGTNTSFTTANAFIPGTLQLWVNGIKQQRGVHFTEGTAPAFTISDAPLTGDNVLVAYQFVTGVTGNADTVDGFNASSTPTANTILPLDSNAQLPAANLNWGGNSHITNIYKEFYTSGNLTGTSGTTYTLTCTIPRALTAGESVMFLPSKLNWCVIQGWSLSGTTLTVSCDCLVNTSLMFVSVNAIYYVA